MTKMLKCTYVSLNFWLKFVTDELRHFAYHCVFYTKNMAERNQDPLVSKVQLMFSNIITKNRMHGSHCVNVWQCSAIIIEDLDMFIITVK